VHRFFGFNHWRDRRLVRIDDCFDDDRALRCQRFSELIAAQLGILDPESAASTRLGELDEIDGRHLDAVFGIAEEDHLLPLDHSQDVVLEHDDLNRQPVLNTGRELGHQHLHAAITDKGDALPLREGKLRGHGVRKAARHRRQGAAQGEALAAADPQHLTRPQRNGSGVAADDCVVSQDLAQLPGDHLRLHWHGVVASALSHEVPPVRGVVLGLFEQ